MIFSMRVALTMTALLAAGRVEAAVPLVNATCPGNIEVHADEGGPIYINGKEGKLKAFNKNYYEASRNGVTISLSINPDGSASVSYTAKGAGNGICTITDASASTPKNEPSAKATGTGPVVTPGNRPAYCRGEVSGMYGTKPGYVTTAKPKKTSSGTTINGTVDKGSEGIKAFQCRYDAKGRFIDVMALTSDGE